MSKLLFRLRHVPDDEVAEVRELLEAHDIDFFETGDGNWGISMPALWLHDESRYEEARALLDEYQAERARRMREAYAEDLREGRAESLFTTFRRQPLRFLFFVGLACAVLYISISSFFDFA